MAALGRFPTVYHYTLMLKFDQEFSRRLAEEGKACSLRTVARHKVNFLMKNGGTGRDITRAAFKRFLNLPDDRFFDKMKPVDTWELTAAAERMAEDNAPLLAGLNLTRESRYRLTYSLAGSLRVFTGRFLGYSETGLTAMFRYDEPVVERKFAFVNLPDGDAESQEVSRRTIRELGIPVANIRECVRTDW